jgi:Protein of unknown function DUF262
MKYRAESWTIKKLIDEYESGRLNLNPPYQRNDIWSPKTKKHLIDSIQRGYPLPSFFLQAREGNAYDVVDGQQRSRAILSYYKRDLPDESGNLFNPGDPLFLEYELTIVVISEVLQTERIEEFYYRVNKFGEEVNRPERLKALHMGTGFQGLIEKISSSNDFTSLEMFSASARKRIIDQDFVAELLALVR